MRIVHIITRLIIGGAQENTLLSCEGQHDRGHDVTLITGPALGPEGTLLERAQSYGYRVEVIDDMRRAILPMKDMRTYQHLIKRLRELQPDVVHTHSSKAGIIGRWAAKRASGAQRASTAERASAAEHDRGADRARPPAIIHTIHGLAFTASTSALVNNVYKRLERLTAPITTKIVCVADAMREQSLAANIGKPEQYITVYSGMETAPFVSPATPRDDVRRELGIEPQHIVVGTIARLFHLKGHDDLLAAATKLCAEFPNLRFLWLGDGILREQFEQRMTAMNLRDRFILPGMVPPSRVPELTNAMDILAHPSRREGLARALPQGQLAGCPVIAYDVDGNREGLVDGETGFAIRPFDQIVLIEKLKRLLSDEPLRNAMGARGRSFALSRFDTKVMVDGLERVYAEAR